MNKLKIIAFLTLAILAFSLASCASGNKKNNNKNQGAADGSSDNAGENNSPNDDGYIFTETSELTLVLPVGNITDENYEKKVAWR